MQVYRTCWKQEDTKEFHMPRGRCWHLNHTNLKLGNVAALSPHQPPWASCHQSLQSHHETLTLTQGHLATHALPTLNQLSLPVLHGEGTGCCKHLALQCHVATVSKHEKYLVQRVNNLSVFAVGTRAIWWQLAGNGQVYREICLTNIKAYFPFQCSVSI